MSGSRLIAALAILGLGAQLVAAQAPAPAAAAAPDAAKMVEAEKANVPAHKCGPLPMWPGRSAPDSLKKLYEPQMKTYGDCMRLYIEERRAAIKANEAVARALIEDYNTALDRARADVADTKTK